MAPALEPPMPPEVKATRARPLTGLMPTATGARENGLPFASAEGKVSSAVTEGALGVVMSTTASVALALLATRASLRMLSTETDVGPLATVHVEPGGRAEPVQSDVTGLSDGLDKLPKIGRA